MEQQEEGEEEEKPSQHTNSTVPKNARDLLPTRPGALARRIQHAGDQAAFGFPLVGTAWRELIYVVMNRDDAASGCKVLWRSDEYDEGGWFETLGGRGGRSSTHQR